MSGTTSRRWYYIIAAVVVVLAVVIGAALWWNQRNAWDVADPAPLPAPTPVLQAAQSDGPAPDPATVTDALAGPAADPALGKLSGQVTDAATGDVLWTADQDRMLVPASSTKLVTATAALLTLAPDDRVGTQVLRGAEPGQVVLKGNGDVTLQRSPGTGFFTDAASISDLAAQASAALGGEKVTSVVVDNSFRQGDLFNSTWDGADIAAGNVAALGAVMVDAGRLDPSQNYSPRSATPAADAGRDLAAALGAPDVPVSASDRAVATAGEDATLGSVESAPLSTRLRDMMQHSDNLLAESVAREVAAARGAEPTFAGASEATLAALTEAGIDVSGAVLKDNSGMSADNRLSAHILDDIVTAAAGDGDHAAALRPLLDTLPVAAADGSLVDRYGADSGARAGAGWVRAKTGTLDGVNALAGTVTTDSGRVLTFGFLSNGSDMDAGRAALDRLTAALRGL
jgi:D-alanyl-D-alanine carboxypeptidase/D-alanyl-D-alanine-endopeptidase (penicillin-binding protein 4)